MPDNNVIPVFFAIDDNYAPLLCIAMSSITEHASKDYNYEFRVLHIGLSEASRNLITRYHKDNFKVEFVDMKDKLERIGWKLHTRDYYSKSTYYRLFITGMFPNIDKALYLDADIILNGDISELYNTDIGDNYVGAVTEEAVNKVPEFIEYAAHFLGVKTPDYFNAGIMLMNLKAFRQIDLEAKFLKLLSEYKFVVAQDQDYLNVICKGKVHYFSMAWNKNPMIDPRVTRENVKLVHYTLTMKPWHYTGIQFEEMFWEHAEKTGLTEAMLEKQRAFTPEQVRNDQTAYENLKRLARNLAFSHDSYNNIVNVKKKPDFGLAFAAIKKA